MIEETLHMKDTRHTLSNLLCFILLVSFILSGCSPSTKLEYEYVEFATSDSKSYAISRCTGFAESILVPTEHKGYVVSHILDSAFKGHKMEFLGMETIISIYPEAFAFCTRLKDVDLGCVEIIGRRAFENCNSLKEIVIPASVKIIETGAFIRCPELERVYFEGSPEQLEPEIFEAGVLIYGPSGSLVEEYALQNGFTFVDNTAVADNP